MSKILEQDSYLTDGRAASEFASLYRGQTAAFSHATQIGKHGRVAVKIVDDRGIEDLKIKRLA